MISLPIWTITIYYFLLFSFFGWLVESIFFWLKRRKFVSLGFLYGPLLPIYGVVMIVLIYGVLPWLKQPMLLFLLGPIIGYFVSEIFYFISRKMLGERLDAHSIFYFKQGISTVSLLLFAIIAALLPSVLESFDPFIMSFKGDDVRVIGSILFSLTFIDFLVSYGTLFKIATLLKECHSIMPKVLSKEDFDQEINEQLNGASATGLKGLLSEFKGPLIRYKITAHQANGFLFFKESHVYCFILSFIQGERVTVKKNQLSEADEKSFASGLGFYKLFWIFVVASILGYVIETLFCLVKHGYIESRQGLVYGPFSQVYGLGAIVMVLILTSLAKRNNWWVFFGSAIIGGLFEAACSYVQESIFGSVSWSYHGATVGLLGGRTSIVYMLFWGVLGIVFIRFVYPLMSHLIERIPNKQGKVLTWLLFVFLIVDITISAAAVYRWSQRDQGVPACGPIAKMIDKEYSDAVMKHIYPNMKMTQSKK